MPFRYGFWCTACHCHFCRCFEIDAMYAHVRTCLWRPLCFWTAVIVSWLHFMSKLKKMVQNDEKVWGKSKTASSIRIFLTYRKLFFISHRSCDVKFISIHWIIMMVLRTWTYKNCIIQIIQMKRGIKNNQPAIQISRKEHWIITIHKQLITTHKIVINGNDNNSTEKNDIQKEPNASC